MRKKITIVIQAFLVLVSVFFLIKIIIIINSPEIKMYRAANKIKKHCDAGNVKFVYARHEKIDIMVKPETSTIVASTALMRTRPSEGEYVALLGHGLGHLFIMQKHPIIKPVFVSRTTVDTYGRRSVPVEEYNEYIADGVSLWCLVKTGHFPAYAGALDGGMVMHTDQAALRQGFDNQILGLFRFAEPLGIIASFLSRDEDYWRRDRIDYLRRLAKKCVSKDGRSWLC